MLDDYSDLVLDSFNHNNIETDIETLNNNLTSFDKKTNLSVLSVNIRSIRANFNQLLAFTSYIKHEFDFIIVTETWLESSLNVGLDIPGYVSEHIFRNKHGGGISIFYLPIYSVSKISELSTINDCFESLFLNIKCNNHETICLGGVYRPPSCSLTQFNHSFRDTILSKLSFKNLLLAGDFNVNLLKENPSLAERDFNNLLSEFNLYQLIQFPTRVTPESSSLIDHIWTTISPISFSSVTDYPISDHYPICALFPLSAENEPKLITFRTCSENAIDKFTEKFNELHIKYMNCPLNCPHKAMLDFLTDFENLISSIFPFKTIISKPEKSKAPWISRSILQCIRKKYRIYKKYKLGMLPYSSFKSYRNLLNKLLKLAKRNYYHQKVHSCYNNMKQLWSVINKLRNPMSKSAKLSIKIDDEVTEDEKILTNQFNDYFLSLPHTLQDRITHTENESLYNIPIHQTSFNFFPVNPVELKNLIKKTPDKNFHTSPTPPRLIKLVAPQIAEILSRLFNHCISRSIFPDILKVAKVLPLPKKGDSKNIANHRPISILSPFTKLFEKVIFDRLNSFFINNSLFSDQQFGFIKGKGTQDAIVNFLFDVNKAINEKKYTLAVFLDFSKAFDLVVHNILLAKLERYGIRGITLAFFKSYLHNRKQYVSVNGFDSEIKDITTGVPQGSSLGPLFYLIYSNDITSIFQSAKPSLYADDTILYKSSDNIDDLQHTLNNELTHIFNWSNENKLLLNSEKTKCMLFTTSAHPQFKLTLNSSEIEKVKEFKFLGLWLQDNLKFKKHVSELCKAISRANGTIYSLKNTVPFSVLKNLYYAFVFSYINQNILAWGGSFKTTLKPLNVAHNNVIRNLSLNVEGRRTVDLYDDLKLLTISQIYTLRLSEFMHCTVKGQGKLNYDFITDVSWNHEHDTRRAEEFRLYHCRTEINRCFFLNHALKLWQHVPDDIKRSVSLSVFRKNMKSLLLNNANAVTF